MKYSIFLTRIDKLVQVIQAPRLLRALICGRVLAGAEHRRVLSPDLATVVDIGANRGQFALAAREWAPGARVIAFEPLPEPAAKFRMLFQGDSSVRLHQMAIGPEAGEATIHVSFDDDSSSLLPIDEAQVGLFPRTAEKELRNVSVIPLRDVLDADATLAPALLKVDVQGYELEVLRGCEPLLDRFAYVYVECSFAELYQGQALADKVISWLHTRGFRLAGVYNMHYDRRGIAIQGDFLFASGGLPQ